VGAKEWKEAKSHFEDPEEDETPFTIKGLQGVPYERNGEICQKHQATDSEEPFHDADEEYLDLYWSENLTDSELEEFLACT
jgi:hypothetical protein